MANNKTHKPEYVCWYDDAFQADLYVRRGLTWLQRHFYRTLCIAAYFCDTRPYLPNDDDQLWLLADAESLEMWQANRTAVLKKFSAIEIEGAHLLAHKRVLEGWEKVANFYNQRRQAGVNSGKARAQRSLNGRSTGAQRRATTDEHTETETGMEMERDSDSGSGKSQTHSVHPQLKKSVSGKEQQPNPQDSVPNPAGDTSRSPDPKRQIIPANAEESPAAQVRDLWNEIVDTIHTRDDERKWHYELDADETMSSLDGSYNVEYVANSNIVQKYGVADVALTLIWAFRLSNHWWKTHKGHITTWGNFCGVYEIVRQQRDAFFESMKKRGSAILTMADILKLGMYEPKKDKPVQKVKAATARSSGETTIENVEDL